MKNYTDLELKKELMSRGYEVFNKDYATEYLWTLDDAIDSYHEVKNANFTRDELSHEQLMGILNETISSAHVMQMISEELQRNIYENLFEA
jgi:histidinol phosphatase-like PHP family hydrolase